MRDMTEPELPTSAPVQDKSPQEKEKRLVIDREPSFMRFVADEVLVVDLGRDIEFSFLQMGRRIDSRVRVTEEGNESEGFRVAASLTEVSRGRMSPQAASLFAMHIIKVIADRGDIDADALRENIEIIIADSAINESESDVNSLDKIDE